MLVIIKSLGDYDEYSKLYFGNEVSEYVMNDYKKWLENKDFLMILGNDEFFDGVEVLVKVDEKWYYVVERFEGIRYMLVDDKDDLDEINKMLNKYK